jgi:twitching motility protein PilI
MANTLAQPPFQWLQELERRARQKARGLPRQEKVQHIWRGIAFRLGTINLVSALNDIREVMPVPTIMARVPGAKTWVRGLANVHGQLLPIIDTQACLDNRITLLEPRTRVLVINQAGVNAGLLVDEVLGIKHFPEQMRDLETPCKDAWLAPYAKGAFKDEDNYWPVFDLHVLAESDVFLKAALS